MSTMSGTSTWTADSVPRAVVSPQSWAWVRTTRRSMLGSVCKQMYRLCKQRCQDTDKGGKGGCG